MASTDTRESCSRRRRLPVVTHHTGRSVRALPLPGPHPAARPGQGSGRASAAHRRPPQADGEDACILHTGAESPDVLAIYVAVIGTEFEILDPPYWPSTSSPWPAGSLARYATDPQGVEHRARGQGRCARSGSATSWFDPLTTLPDRASVVPPVNQIEVHPIRQCYMRRLPTRHRCLPAIARSRASDLAP
jgi:hypothetical protein